MIYKKHFLLRLYACWMWMRLLFVPTVPSKLLTLSVEVDRWAILDQLSRYQLLKMGSAP
jgi:hypothetical protein